MYYRYIFLLCMSFGFMLALPVFGQTEGEAFCGTNSCCCSDDPTPAGVMISHVHKKNEWMISYRYMGMGMKGLMSGAVSVDKESVFVNYLMAPDDMRMDMHMLMGMYGITPRLTVMAMLNYNSNSMQMSMFDASVHNHPGMGSSPGATHSMKTSGLGDTRLHVLYSLVNRASHQVVASAGVNIPTGSIQKEGGGDEMMYANKRLPYSMQLGSGTKDVLPGITYLYQQEKITFSVQATAVIRMGRNAAGYTLGNESVFGSWVAYRWLSFLSTSLRVEASDVKRIKGYDESLYYFGEPSANPYNYGGTRVNAYTGIVFQPKSGILKSQRLSFEYGMPAYQDLNGIQMKQTQTINASWSMNFN